ncbi:MAG: hypothetical protein ACI4QR_03335, partial [Eubacteriales bacterium]
MKKKILSVFLSVFMLISCFATLSIHDHDHVHAAEATLEDLHEKVEDLKTYIGSDDSMIYFGNGVLKGKLDTIKSIVDALGESLPQDNADYTYYNTVNTKYTARLDIYANYKSKYNAAKAITDTASESYYNAYNAVKAIYDPLKDKEKDFVNGGNGSQAYVFANLTVPTYVSGEKSEITAIKNATTLAALTSAVTAAETKNTSAPTYFNADEKTYIMNARKTLSLLTQMKNAGSLQKSISNTGLSTVAKTIYEAYIALPEDMKTIVSHITDVTLAAMIGQFTEACSVATDFLKLSSYENPQIEDIKARWDRLSDDTKNYYFVDPVTFGALVNSAYNEYIQRCTVVFSGTYDKSLNRIIVTMNVTANAILDPVIITVTPSNSAVALKLLNNSSAVTGIPALGGTAYITQGISGSYTITITDTTVTSGSVVFSFSLPSSSSGSIINFPFTVSFGSNENTKTYSQNLSVACCTHRSGY